MKTGFELLRNGALAAALAFGVTGLAACDQGEDASPPAEEPAAMDEMAPEDTGSTMDEAADMAEDAMEEAEEAVDEAIDAVEEGAEDAGEAMDKATEDAKDKLGM
ncbi:MAG: hypothetical protein D6763_04575 [Alphaproteobacteria bacterium]|nr:MAG: hypothetical protein D6763_04575 [Alphaproteobacteria bacterium]